MRRWRTPALALALLLTGCAGPGRVPEDAGLEPFRQPVELADTPFFPQQAYQCGPAALAGTLAAAGVAVQPHDLVPLVWLPARGGSLQLELVAAARRFDVVPYRVAPEPAALLRELVAGRPVLVLQNLGFASRPVWHYAVLIGYQPDPEVFVLRSGTNPRLEMAGHEFLRSWQLAARWALVLLPAGQLPGADDPGGFLRAVAGLEATGRIEAARTAYAASTRRWPGQPAAWIGLGNAHHAAGDLAAAETAFRRALDVAPRDPVALNNLAETLAARGCLRAAEAALDEGLRAPGPSPALRASLEETRLGLEARAGARAPEPASCRRQTPRSGVRERP